MSAQPQSSHGQSSGGYGPGHGPQSDEPQHDFDSRPGSRGSKHHLDNGTYSSGSHAMYGGQHGGPGHSDFGDEIQGDDDDMW